MRDLLRFADSIRVGHATNSSSTHSIVLLDGSTDRWHAPTPGEYGWESFVLLHRAEKLDYLWHALRQYLEHRLRLPSDVHTYRAADAGIQVDLPGRVPGRIASAILEHVAAHTDGYGLDHQSTFSWPLDRQTGLPHVGFARWYRDRVLDDTVAVLGGNDNEKGPRPPGQRVAWALKRDEFGSTVYCHDRTDHWLLWEPEYGIKLRVPKVDGAHITRSAVPELVDVKITDQCGRGCRFCYQASTPSGSHAGLRTYDMARSLAELGVLEVAIGGGEPLEHPEFWDFVRVLREHGVVANVTTRRLDLIPAWRVAQFGGIGFSAETAAAFAEGLRSIDGPSSIGRQYDNPWRARLVFHVVLGATPLDEVVRICELARDERLPVLLLGWKDDGRGASFRAHPHDDWVEVLRAAFTNADGYWTGPRIGVDTPIVERWGAELQDRLRVDPRLMVGGEGAFSLYVDFVVLTVSRASYGPGERVPLPPRDQRQDSRAFAAAVLDVFRSWA